MHIIEVKALDNGAHRNQNGGISTIPDGWAVIPDDMEIPDTFPFVNITVEGQVVTSMSPGVVPEPEDPITPDPTPEEKIQTLEEQLATTQDAVDFILMNM